MSHKLPKPPKKPAARLRNRFRRVFEQAQLPPWQTKWARKIPWPIQNPFHADRDRAVLDKCHFRSPGQREGEATRSSGTRATIEGRARIAAAKQNSLPQATSASMGSGGADCLEAQAHWPCGHARGLNGKMPVRTQRSVGSWRRSAERRNL